MKKKKSFSIRQFYSIILWILISVSVFLGGVSIGTSYYFFSVEDNLVRDTFTSEKEYIVSSLYSDELYFSYLLINSDDINTLSYSDDEIDIYLAKKSLNLAFNTYLTQNNAISYVAFYNRSSSQFISYDNGLQPYNIEIRQSIRNRFSDYIINNSSIENNTCFTVVNSGVTYLCRALSLEGSMIFLAYNYNDIVKYFVNSPLIEIALKHEDNIISSREDINVDNFDKLNENKISYHSFLKEKIIKSSLYDFDIAMIYKVEAINITAEITIILLYVVVLVISIMSIYAISMFKKKVVDPLKVLESTMKEISNGNLELRIEEGDEGQEIKDVNMTFNKMLEDIHELKIEAYEKEIMTKKAELKFLQLQIRPHFYLNCLKNMYVLAVDNKLEKIEESILLLSNYLRYSFTIQENGVKVVDEVKQCENYTKLIAQSAKYPPLLITDIEEETKDIVIPSISLLTFLENTFKHAPISRRVVTAFISSKLEDDKKTLHLTFLDDGEGVDEKTLEKLNKLDWNDDSLKEHTGIKNVINRFGLLFSKAPKVIFDNSNGFRVDIYIDLKDGE